MRQIYQHFHLAYLITSFQSLLLHIFYLFLFKANELLEILIGKINLLVIFCEFVSFAIELIKNLMNPIRTFGERTI